MLPQHPIASRLATVSAILKESGRPDKVPFRSGFVQRGERGNPTPGPLADIVRRGRDRAWEQYALAVAWASHEPWDVRRDSRLWARAIGLTADRSGSSAVSRNWAFLASINLIMVERSRRLARITLLREDGSGEPYEHHPARDKPSRYLTLPFAYWTGGFNETLSLAAKAMLLIALDLPNGFPLPAERAHDWYGISETTARKGFRELRERGVLVARREWKEAPLAPMGYTAVNFYTLKEPFGPKTTGTPRPVPEGTA